MLEQLKEILGKILPDMDLSEVTEDTNLADDLGFDSLALMLMAMGIEEEFGFRFEEFVKFETVGDVYDFLADKI